MALMDGPGSLPRPGAEASECGAPVRPRRR